MLFNPYLYFPATGPASLKLREGQWQPVTPTIAGKFYIFLKPVAPILPGQALKPGYAYCNCTIIYSAITDRKNR
jgi:hypothetical protein